MKCVFVILDSGASIRNILRTDVFRVLKEQEDIKLVVFSPVVDEDFIAEFKADNVLIEPLPRWKPNPLVKSIRSLRKDIWADKVKLFTYQSRREKKQSRFFKRILLWLLGGKSSDDSDSIIKSLEGLEARFTPSLDDEYFEKYNPEAVFYTTLYSKDPSLEIGAQQRNLKTICFIHSWDNPTSKGPFPFVPQKVVVWNEILKQEVMQFHDIPAENIHICGVPQFDIYYDKSKFLDREAFFKKWHLDPEKRLITYTTGTTGMIPFDHEIVELLYDALLDGKFAYPSQLLVRLHPKDKYKIYRKFEGKEGLVVQMPGRQAATNDSWNPTLEDMYGLAELMHYSDVVANVASTTTIDAAAFDTPVVNVAFDGHETKPYKSSCRRYYDYEHYKNILKTGGVKLASTKEELIEYINLYLVDPSIDKEGREAIRLEQCWRLDGQSGKRIAEVILGSLNDVKRK